MNYTLTEKSVTVLTDDFPDFDTAAAEKLCGFLRDSGYIIKQISAAVFKKNIYDLIASMRTLLIPQCECLPAELMSTLKKWVEYGGQLLTLSGPLFYDNIAWENGAYIKKPLPENCLDTTFMTEYIANPFVYEGFSPSYKVYRVAEPVRLEAISEQVIFNGESPETTAPVICPSPRPFGGGFGMNRRNRFIPLVKATALDHSDAYNPNERGTAAFIMLNEKTSGGHMGENMARPGYVMPSIHCTAAAGIGITEPNVIGCGAGGLILSILDTLARGLYLLEGGADRYCFGCNGGSVKVGARIMNTSLDFKRVNVKIDTGAKTFTGSLLVAPYCISKLSFNAEDSDISAERIVTELEYNGRLIDKITQKVNIVTPILTSSEDFVKVKDGHFVLRGERWQAAGINYWPSYYPSMEIVDYWRGWLDKSNYDSTLVERDLGLIERMGFNCLLTRLDTLNTDNYRAPLADFIARLRRHGLKLMISVPLIESPGAYSSEAFKQFIIENNLAGEPVVFAHDIAWESGSHYLGRFRDSYIDEFNRWISDHYENVEDAISDWDFDPGCNEAGRVRMPDYNQQSNDGEYRVYVAAYRRFADDYFGRLFIDTVNDMKRFAPNHLYTFRQGPSSCTDIAYSATAAATDFVCPEGYHIQGTPDGLANACFSTAYLRFLTGQPVFWAEYGKSSCGIRWTKLEWNHDSFNPPEENMRIQTEYNSVFHEMFVKAAVDGSAPWWWCGGFRRTEMSDFGFIAPDGKLRSWAIEYLETIKKLIADKNVCTPDEFLTVDRDLNAGGNQYICDHIGREDWKRCDASGKKLGIVSEAEGVTSADVPAVAVGNRPFTGKNPHKYLNSLVTLTVENGLIRADIINTRECRWLSDVRLEITDVNKTVVLCLPHEVARLGKVTVEADSNMFSGTVKARLKHERFGYFGEIGTIKI